MTETHKTRRLNIGKAAMAAFETFVLAEILWFYLTTGEQTLHGAVRDWLDDRLDQLAHAAQVAETRSIIRNLPETRQ
jgi:hypothetical protein